MAAKNPWTQYILLLIAALILLGVNFMKNRKYVQKTEPIFELKADEVVEITVAKDTLAVSLAKADTLWIFATADTGEVNQSRIENFLKNIVEDGQYSGFQTSNPEKYSEYGIDDEKATKVTLKLADASEKTFYASRSKSGWTHDYIRFEKDSKVYITTKKIMIYFSERAGFWRK
ncbi:MAG: DUF4340 domain-containing protein [Candidatus Marinimicrobia bacterium]|nr:DUF4340 domain-containing protein [Candidatus Neomarinimicrobiota bacterium]